MNSNEYSSLPVSRGSGTAICTAWPAKDDSKAFQTPLSGARDGKEEFSLIPQ